VPRHRETHGAEADECDLHQRILLASRAG